MSAGLSVESTLRCNCYRLSSENAKNGRACGFSRHDCQAANVNKFHSIQGYYELDCSIYTRKSVQDLRW